MYQGGVQPPRLHQERDKHVHRYLEAYAAMASRFIQSSRPRALIQEGKQGKEVSGRLIIRRGPIVGISSAILPGEGSETRIFANGFANVLLATGQHQPTFHAQIEPG